MIATIRVTKVTPIQDENGYGNLCIEGTRVDTINKMDYAGTFISRELSHSFIKDVGKKSFSDFVGWNPQNIPKMSVLSTEFGNSVEKVTSYTLVPKPKKATYISSRSLANDFEAVGLKISSMTSHINSTDIHVVGHEPIFRFDDNGYFPLIKIFQSENTVTVRLCIMIGVTESCILHHEEFSTWTTNPRQTYYDIRVMASRFKVLLDEAYQKLESSIYALGFKEHKFEVLK